MLIVALDPPPKVDVSTWILHRYERLKDIVQGFKIGLPAIVSLGANYLAKHIKHYKGLLIADLKLADIGDIMAVTARVLSEVGFNAIIAHSFIGYTQGLETLARVCREENLKLILVISMSHEGSKEFIDKHIDEFIELAKKVESWGIVGPATRPDIIRYIRSKVGASMKILAPGIGVQGAEPGMALCAGADYEIVGRSITYADDLIKVAQQVIEQQRRRLSICRG